MDYRIISMLIPLVVIILAVFTKRIIPSLITGILIGGIFLAKGNIIQGVIAATDHIVKSTANYESVYIIMFLFLFGSFGEIMKVSGGIKGFVELTNKKIKTEKGALGTVWLVTAVTFIDCCFHGMAAGTVGKALIDKVDGSKRKLAFVLNVTSCLLIILIPFGTTYVGYIMEVISSAFNNAGLNRSAYSVYIKSIPFNFYAIIMVLISIGVILFDLRFDRKLKSGIGNNQLEKSEHDHDEAHKQCKFAENMPPRPLNLIIPLGILIATTFFFLWYIGEGHDNGFWVAIINAQFEKSVLMSAIVSIVVTSIIYVFQRIPMKEIESHFLSGGSLGDNASPLGETAILSSTISDISLMEHIKSQLPYSLTGVLISTILFIIFAI